MSQEQGTFGMGFLYVNTLHYYENTNVFAITLMMHDVGCSLPHPAGEPILGAHIPVFPIFWGVHHHLDSRPLQGV